MFPPNCSKLVDKAIDLLRLVPSLRSNTKNTAMEGSCHIVLDEVVNVIEFYSQLGRGLDLHEFACLAFCRALEMGPFLLRYMVYVKEGVYDETVTVTRKMVNVTMYGDGQQMRIITGNKNFVDGVRTFQTASFGQDITLYISNQDRAATLDVPSKM